MTTDVNVRRSQLDVLEDILEKAGSNAGTGSKDIVVITYHTKTAFTGAGVGDMVTATKIIDTENATLVSTLWYNESTSSPLATVPNLSNLELMGSSALTDIQLRASPVAVALAGQATTILDNTAAAVTDDATQLVAANANRIELEIYNAGPDPVAVGGAGIAWSKACSPLMAGDTRFETTAPNVAWYAICATGNTASVTTRETRK
jgi:hypothetical protein